MQRTSLVCIAFAVPALAVPAVAQSVTRVSVTSSGAQVTGGHSEAPALSHDGRYVAFDNSSPGLVPGDTNNRRDVFVHDRYTGAIERVSVATWGAEGNGDSSFASMSADGRYVAFETGATNFDAVPANNYIDIYVRDRQLGVTLLAVKTSSGAPSTYGHSMSPKLSANGAYVVFESDSNQITSGDNGAFTDVFLHVLATGFTEKISVSTAGMPGTSNSFNPAVSGDGDIVAYESGASNLIAGDTNNASDIFVRRRILNTTERVSVSSAGV
jgi:Tol biopolymer transport system component